MKTARRTVEVHAYADDGTRDHRHESRCATCGLPRGNAHHQLPDTAEATAEHDRRYDPDATR